MPSYPQYPLKATQHRSNAQHTANCCVFSAFCFSGEWGGYRPSSNARSKTPTPCPRKLVFIHKYKQNKRTKKTHGKAPDFDNFLSVFRTLPLYRLPKNRQLLLNNTPVLAHCSRGHQRSPKLSLTVLHYSSLLNQRKRRFSTRKCGYYTSASVSNKRGYQLR